MTEASAGPKLRVERRILTDGRGRIAAVQARAGCVEAVLARRNERTGRMVMPSRGVMTDRLAEVTGSLGGLLSIAFTETERELIDAGYRIKTDGAAEFLSCTERGSAASPICRTLACPWALEGETYESGECPMDRWKTIHD